MPGVDVEMDINIFRGAVLLVLMFAFIGLWAWAWNRKRKPAFHEASMLPLEEDYGTIPNSDGPGNESPGNEGMADADQPMEKGVNHVN
jgi:cytochrome c oxidase cbb3-type subunit 4